MGDGYLLTVGVLGVWFLNDGRGRAPRVPHDILLQTLKRSALLKRFCNDYKDDTKQLIRDDDLRAEVADP